MPKLVIQPQGPDDLRAYCGVTLDRELSEQIGIHRGHISRILGGKHAPGNRFIASVIDRCGLKFAFDHVFVIVPDES